MTDIEARKLVEAGGSYFTPKPLVSRAVKLTAPIELEINSRKVLKGRAGDYLIEGPTGELDIKSGRDFELFYERGRPAPVRKQAAAGSV